MEIVFGGPKNHVQTFQLYKVFASPISEPPEFSTYQGPRLRAIVPMCLSVRFLAGLLHRQSEVVAYLVGKAGHL